MERVVTINLNGNSYQLEEPAYDALRAYMTRAEAALVDNPDKAEIVRDLQQAIADKCAARLSSSKTVISAAEMASVLEEMGPVQGDNVGSGQSSGASPRKRLYRIRDDAKIAGVCAGIGAYFDLDANIVRLLFVVAALFTSGLFILVYVAMMFLIPSVHTSAEWAAAHGLPFNAQEVIDRAKREYQRFTDETARDWRASWRAQRRAWRDELRAQRHARSHFAAQPAAPPAGYLTRVFAGLAAFILSVIGAALLIAFLVALFALLSTGAFFGWAPPADIPLWLAIVVLCIGYAALASPLALLRRSSFAAASGYAGNVHAADSAMVLAAIFLGGFFAYHLLPDFRVWIEQVPDALRAIGRSFDL